MYDWAIMIDCCSRRENVVFSGAPAASYVLTCPEE